MTKGSPKNDKKSPQGTTKRKQKTDQRKAKGRPKESEKKGWRLADCVTLIDYTGKPTSYKINAVLFVYNLMGDYKNGLRK